MSAQSREGEQLARKLESTDAAIAPKDLQTLGGAVEGVARAFADALQTLDPDNRG